MLFIAKSENKNLSKNNPGADRPVYFWFKIPAESRVCPVAHRRVQDSTDTSA